jgi:hypothetical protein
MCQYNDYQSPNEGNRASFQNVVYYIKCDYATDNGQYPTWCFYIKSTNINNTLENHFLSI